MLNILIASIYVECWIFLALFILLSNRVVIKRETNLINLCVYACYFVLNLLKKIKKFQKSVDTSFFIWYILYALEKNV